MPENRPICVHSKAVVHRAATSAPTKESRSPARSTPTWRGAGGGPVRAVRRGTVVRGPAGVATVVPPAPEATRSVLVIGSCLALRAGPGPGHDQRREEVDDQ